jgi:uncharacterized membrane protein
MKKKNVITLGYTAFILIPTMRNTEFEGKALRAKQRVVEYFTELYGGATTSIVNGAYKMENGNIAYDESIKIEVAYGNRAGKREQIEDDLVWQAQRQAERLQQESILINIDGVNYLVFPES